MIATSLAIVKAAAAATGEPLYHSFGGKDARTLPAPLLNVLNGGAHATNNVDIQEFTIAPAGVRSFREALRIGAEIFAALKRLLQEKGLTTAVGDEGGVAPDLRSNEEAMEVLLEAITRAGYRPGGQVSLALDVAATELYDNGKYVFRKACGTARSPADLIELYRRWAEQYPLVSIEDGLAEDDWEEWQLLIQELGAKLQLVGDDLFVTNPLRLARGMEAHAANAILVKVNQLGVLAKT